MGAVLACVVLLFFQAAVPKPASIDGVVRRVGTGEPVMKARVLISGSSSSPSNAQMLPKVVTTDKDGRFTVPALHPGRYVLTASANGFVKQVYGQKGPNLAGLGITLTAGQELNNVVFDMVPSGVITGRIYDFDNMPLPSADVVLQKMAYDANGQRTMQVIQEISTNDLGEYRLFWITPGKYFLSAKYTGRQSAFRNDNEFTGPIEDGYAVPTFYPGTSDPSQADEIDLLPGGQLSAIDLTLMRSQTYTVKGRVIVSVAVGNDARPRVGLYSRVSNGASSIHSTINPDGTFELRNVASGQYTLYANTGGSTPTDSVSAEKALDVNGDVEGVSIVISPGFDLQFRIVYESQPVSNAAQPPVTMRPSLRVPGDATGRSVSTNGLSDMVNPPKVKPDGTFTLSNVVPGVYQIQLQPLPPDHYIKAVTLGHTDALREGIRVDRTPDTPIEILLSPNAGIVKGTVVDRDGKPMPSSRVYLIPSDRTRTDRFRGTLSGTTGEFQIHGIYPGEYKLFSWEGLELNAERDPSFLQRYEEQGRRVVVVEGANPGVEVPFVKVSPQ